MLSPAQNPACQAMPSPGPSGPGGAEVAPKVPRRIFVGQVGLFQSILVIAFCSRFLRILALQLGFNAYSVM